MASAKPFLRLCEPLEPRRLLASTVPVYGPVLPATLLSPSETLSSNLTAPRAMENLGRGVVATRASSSQVFVSWRLLALDPAGIGFNVYRSANGAAPVKLNGSPLVAGTNYTDTSANATLPNAYFVRPVIGGVEQPPSARYTLAANAVVAPVFSVPIQNLPGALAADYYVHHSWVGDLDGDGEFEFVVDRIPNIANATDKVQAYRRDGTLLWTIDMGPNSLNKNNIEPGPSTISVGNWDGVTVADLDLDGRAEVLLRTAGGVIFGNGAVLPAQANVNTQFFSVINGLTGAERTRTVVPADYISDGPLATSLGVGYLDGVRPSLVAKQKNRIGSGAFNLMVTAWDFNGTTLSQKWKWKRGSTNAPDGHQIRIVDVDQDGIDDVADIGYVLNGNTGTLKYSLAGQGVVHGDRFYVGDLDPARPGLEGYGIQQDNPSGLIEYYYDAGTGTIIDKHFTDISGGLVDNGRGVVGDIDATRPGSEYWSFYGIYNAPTNTQLTVEPNRPYPNFRLWWDGDLLAENLNEEKIEKWNAATGTVSRLLTPYQSPMNGNATWRGAPTLYGDLFGDWREEVVFEKDDHSALQVLTTNVASTNRLYTLAQNPAYRNCLTIKGYLQSHLTDYFLGTGMAPPPTPNVIYAGGGLSVLSSDFNFATSPNTLTVRFNGYVGASLGLEDLIVRRVSNGATIVPTGLAYDLATNTATVTLPANLPNDDYTATWTATGFADPGGRQLAGNLVQSFFVLAGDLNRDRAVNFADLLVLAQNYNQTGKSYAQGNLDGSADGRVDFADLLILAQHYGQSLPSTASGASQLVSSVATRAKVSR